MSAERDQGGGKPRDEEARRRAIAEIPEAWTPGALSTLIEAMGDPSWRVRKDAVSRVARWPDVDGAVALLVSTLSDDSNVGLRNAAVEALAAIGLPSVAPLVTALDAGGEHRKFLVDALGAVRERAAVPALIRCLHDPDENVRAAAAEALGVLGGAEAVSALRALLDGPDLLARLAALEALNSLEAELDVQRIVPLLPLAVLRRAALEALGLSGDLEALPYLLDALATPARGAREAAQVAISQLHEVQATEAARARIESSVRAAPPAAVQGLIASVSAETARVRRASVQLLGWGRWPEALPRLVDALRDEEIHDESASAIVAYGPTAIAPLVELARETGQDLRAEVFALFPRLGAAAADARVGALLSRALEDDDPETAAAAARALGDVGGKDSLAALFHALGRDDHPAVPHAASHALGKLGLRYYDEVRMLIGARGLEREAGVHLCRVLGAIGRGADRPLLLAALRADDASLRRAAAEAVAALGPAPEAREALVYALADEDQRVRASAAEALGELADPAATPPLAGATADEDEVVRAAATRALGRLGDLRAAPVLRELARRASGQTAVHAMEALGRLRPSDPLDESIFASAVDRADPEIVKAALKALAPRTGTDVVAALTRALGHERWDVRRLAAEILGARLTEPGVVDALERRARVESDPLAREAIEVALASRGS